MTFHSLGWIALTTVLALSTFGVWLCSLVFVFSVFLTAGIFMSIYMKCSRPVISADGFVFYLKHPENGIPLIVQYSKRMPSKPLKYDQRITGSSIVDEPLQEMLRYTIRDYISYWYNDFTIDQDFIYNIKDVVQKVATYISNRCKEVDWGSFLTINLVDDFASHLRLYRQAQVKLKAQNKTDESLNLLKCFFDLEKSMERNLCRSLISNFKEEETEYLESLTELLLYLILPPEDFHNTPFKFIVRELAVNTLLLPFFALLADPDYINQTIIWLLRDNLVSSKAFLAVINSSDSAEELNAVKEIVKHEILVENSKDTGDKNKMKQNISSLQFVKDALQSRFQHLQNPSDVNNDSSSLFSEIDWTTTVDCNVHLYTIPFETVLSHNIALHYFTEYMTSIGAQGHILFYHNVEGFRASAEMLFSEMAHSNSSDSSELEKLRELALGIFENYLSKKMPLESKLDATLLNKLRTRIKTEKPIESWFDQVQSKVYEIMQKDEEFFPSFKKTQGYVKLLAELDFLSETSIKFESDAKLEEEEEIEVSVYDTVIFSSLAQEGQTLFFENPNPQPYQDSASFSSLPSTEPDGSSSCTNREDFISANIYNIGVTHHAGKSFAVYAIDVLHQTQSGQAEKWYVVRRYSEFHDFHLAVIQKFPHLSTLPFPPKKTFNNLNRHLLEKRRQLLNDYLQCLLDPNTLNSCQGLCSMLHNFLEHKMPEKEKKPFVRSVSTPLKSIKNVGSMVKSTPFSIKEDSPKTKRTCNEPLNPILDTDKVLTLGESEGDDMIPIRIILLLMDEIFDLKNKDQWFRRRIVAILRQIIKATYGDTINKKIMDWVEWMTSAEKVSEYLKTFRNSFWPSGILAAPIPERDQNTKLRTCVATKMMMICSVPDELRHVIGSETANKGIICIYNMFQHSTLNRRLAYTIFESLLKVLFPHNNLPELFCKLHSKKNVDDAEIKNSLNKLGDEKVGKTR